MLLRAAQRLRDDGYGSTNLEFERRRTPELARVRVIEVSIRVTPRSTTDRINRLRFIADRLHKTLTENQSRLSAF
jgi:hypothetical protein